MEKLITTHLVKSFDLGINGRLYGGRMLDWIDEAGALLVHQIADSYFVTWKINEIVFHVPVICGEILNFFVENIDVRNSSIGFDVVVKNLNGTKILTTNMVFVCVGEDGKKKVITNFRPNNYYVSKNENDRSVEEF